MVVCLGCIGGCLAHSGQIFSLPFAESRGLSRAAESEENRDVPILTGLISS